MITAKLAVRENTAFQKSLIIVENVLFIVSLYPKGILKDLNTENAFVKEELLLLIAKSSYKYVQDGVHHYLPGKLFQHVCLSKILPIYPCAFSLSLIKTTDLYYLITMEWRSHGLPLALTALFRKLFIVSFCRKLSYQVVILPQTKWRLII